MIQGRRLPERYEIAHPDDPAIDWKASAEALGMDLKDLPEEAIASAGQLKYSEARPSATLPLKPLPEMQITSWICRPLTNIELAEIDDTYGPQYDVGGIGVDGKPEIKVIRQVNANGMALAAYRAAVVEVKNVDGEVPYPIALNIGQRILQYNRLGEDEQLF